MYKYYIYIYIYIYITLVHALYSGDRNCTLQATNYATGMDIDTELKKIWLSGRGQGSPENYEFLAYFLANKTDFKTATIKPFFFLIGDAKYFEKLGREDMNRVFGIRPDGEIKASELWTQALAKTNFFYLSASPHPHWDVLVCLTASPC
jgi:hypothetical protein